MVLCCACSRAALAWSAALDRLQLIWCWVVRPELIWFKDCAARQCVEQVLSMSLGWRCANAGQLQPAHEQLQTDEGLCMQIGVQLPAVLAARCSALYILVIFHSVRQPLLHRLIVTCATARGVVLPKWGFAR